MPGAHLTLAKKTEQLPTGDKIHYHVQVVDVLERAPEINQEGVAYADKHLPLGVRMLDLLHLYDLLLVQHFDGIEAAIVTRANEVHASE